MILSGKKCIFNYIYFLNSFGFWILEMFRGKSNFIASEISKKLNQEPLRYWSVNEKMKIQNYLSSLGLVWFLCRLFNAKAILIEEQSRYYLTHSWEDKEVHTVHKGICSKVNVIVRLEFELAYYDSAVHRFNHYTTRTPPSRD